MKVCFDHTILCVIINISLGPAKDDDQHNRESRRRRPSTKVTEQSKWLIRWPWTLIPSCVAVEAENEKARLEAEKEMRREERLKKQQRKHNKAAGQELQSDDDLEELPDAAVCTSFTRHFYTYQSFLTDYIPCCFIKACSCCFACPTFQSCPPNPCSYQSPTCRKCVMLWESIYL